MIAMNVFEVISIRSLTVEFVLKLFQRVYNLNVTHVTLFLCDVKFVCVPCSYITKLKLSFC